MFGHPSTSSKFFYSTILFILGYKWQHEQQQRIKKLQGMGNHATLCTLLHNHELLAEVLEVRIQVSTSKMLPQDPTC